MKSKKRKQNLTSLIEAFERIKHNKDTIVPAEKGWETRENYAKSRGIGKDKACRELKSMVTRGMVSIKRFHVQSMSGTYMLIPHYRVKA